MKKYIKFLLNSRDFPSSFHDTRSVFIHIPKAAGTSVALALYGHQIEHKTAAQWYVSRPNKYGKYYKFTFVRDPYQRLISAYKFLKVGGISRADLDWKNTVLDRYRDFEDFVLNGLKKTDVLEKAHFAPQTKFLLIRGRMAVDFVGKFESLDVDFERISKRLGLKAELKHLNKTSDRKHLIEDSMIINDRMREVVREVYYSDFQMFHYTS